MGLGATGGATIAERPQHAGSGGHHARIADPDGVVREIAHNPGWSVDTSGRGSLHTVER